MLLRVNLASSLLLRRGAMTIEQIKTLYGKYQTTDLFAKLDIMDKKEGVLLYLCTITLILR